MYIFLFLFHFIFLIKKDYQQTQRKERRNFDRRWEMEKIGKQYLYSLYFNGTLTFTEFKYFGLWCNWLDLKFQNKLSGLDFVLSHPETILWRVKLADRVK